MATQCPHCGGYRVTADRTEALNGPWGNQLLLPFILAACGAISLGYQFSNGNLSSMLGCGTVLFFVFFGLAVWMQGASNRLYATRKRYWFRCLLCGYQWVWATGEPLPPVQDRPDLRQAGEARLRAEDAAARHVAEDILWRKPWDQK